MKTWLSLIGLGTLLVAALVPPKKYRLYCRAERAVRYHGTGLEDF